MNLSSAKNEKWLWGSLFLFGLIGIILRFYHITQNQFVYYDEGLYLNINRQFLYLIEHNFPKSFYEFSQTIKFLFFLCLETGKAFWIFLSDLRVYFLGVEAWYFPRMLSAIFGSLSIWVSYLFAKRYFQSQLAGVLAAVLLAVFPSHVYYSRLGLQESCSTFCYLLGMYLYCFPRKLNWKTFGVGILFACVYFTNYRMIIVPVLVAVAEAVMSFSAKEKFDYRKYVWSMLIFSAIVVLVGNLYNARNSVLTFSWMFYQSHLAESEFSLINFLSYPFYLFYLESILFGCFFFASIYLVFKREWAWILPLALVLAQMLIFSLVSDKATRYLCTTMPFMNIMVAGFIVYWLNKKNFGIHPRWLMVALLAMIGMHLFRSIGIAQMTNAYETSIRYLLSRPEGGKILSTQHYIQNLYVKEEDEIIDAPKRYRFLIALYSSGYKYLIVDPQAYISYTQDERHFSPQLIPYLDFISSHVKPIKIYDHFDDEMLRRFVMEHNENLKRSLEFLWFNKDKQRGTLKIYDVRECLNVLRFLNTRYANTIQYLQETYH